MTVYAVRADAALQEHRALRVAEADGPRGPASFFFGRFVTRPGTVVDGAPGTWAPDAAGRAALQLTATAADGVRIGGELVDGTATLFLDPADGPPVAAFPNGAEGILFTYDGTRFALQVWDQHSEWADSFAGIQAWDLDPDWVVPASVHLIDSERTVAMSHHRDPRPVDVPVIAEVSFTYDGQEHTLLATSRGEEHGGMVLLFTDATSGPESYAAGRVLMIPDVKEGPIQLDFNYAELLPCAFSLAWNCPIPPGENRLDLRIRAGERYAVRRDRVRLL